MKEIKYWIGLTIGMWVLTYGITIPVMQLALGVLVIDLNSISYNKASEANK